MISLRAFFISCTPRLLCWWSMISAEELVGAEWAEWYRLTPVQRWQESEKLWQTYLALGGSLDPEPDTQSPFFDASAARSRPAHGRTGVRVLGAAEFSPTFARRFGVGLSGRHLRDAQASGRPTGVFDNAHSVTQRLARKKICQANPLATERRACHFRPRPPVADNHLCLGAIPN